MTKFIPPTTGVSIAMNTGHTLECEMWHDDFDMFREMWTSKDVNVPQVITLPSVAGDDMTFDTSNIAMVHRFSVEEFDEQEMEDVYDEFDEY